MAFDEIPQHFKQWELSTTQGIDGLKLVEDASIGKVGDEEVVVEMYAASLNFLDLWVAKGGHPGMLELEKSPGLITGCDGAGVVKAAGSAVKSFTAGDKVITYLISHIADDEKVDFTKVGASIGIATNGTLTQYGKFHVSNLVHAPKEMSFEQAATLPCSALTAYNALLGLRGRQVEKGQWVLVQGTGGVSVAGLQIALAVGAHVVATTSSAEKAAKLKSLGVESVINYRETPEWGLPARELTPDNAGFDHVLDVGGENTIGESVKAVKTDGVVTTIGLVGGPTEKQVPIMAASHHACIVRGIVAGTRQQMRELVTFVDKVGLKPALDDVEFGIEQVRDAYWRQEKQQHFSKVVIKLRD
ncbi:hypothetical protein LTR22_026389 [Elasticomyces elasticus]|nr:hypothetical protein LTR22_026389 [Elasticomyces elasticus]KAK5762318.1 hypothetical protein LTS12_007477 [Elasticomyces elasticus]